MKRVLPAVLGVLLLACGPETDSENEAAPECSLVAPVAGAGFDGSITAVVRLGGSVQKIEFLLAGNVVHTKDGVSAPADVTVTFPTTGMAEGSYALTARAINGAGDATVSAPVQVLVDRTAPQAVSIQLDRYAVLPASSDVTVAYQESNVKAVRLMEGTRVLAESTGAVTSVNFTVTAETEGLHYLTAAVEDSAGHVATSAEIPVIAGSGAEEVLTVTYDPNATAFVPANYQSAEYDTRAMVATDVGIRRVVTWVTWDASSGWRLKFGFGEGLCPERGIEFTNLESDTGEAVIDLPRVALSSAAEARLPAAEQGSAEYPHNHDDLTFGKFFAHIRPLEPADHVGESIPVSVHFAFFY